MSRTEEQLDQSTQQTAAEPNAAGVDTSRIDEAVPAREDRKSPSWLKRITAGIGAAATLFAGGYAANEVFSSEKTPAKPAGVEGEANPQSQYSLVGPEGTIIEAPPLSLGPPEEFSATYQDTTEIVHQVATEPQELADQASANITGVINSDGSIGARDFRDFFSIRGSQQVIDFLRPRMVGDKTHMDYKWLAVPELSQLDTESGQGVLTVVEWQYEKGQQKPFNVYGGPTPYDILQLRMSLDYSQAHFAPDIKMWLAENIRVLPLDTLQVERT